MTATAPTLAAATPTLVRNDRGRLGLLAHQLRYEARVARRNPVFLGFTFGTPLLMLVVFAALSDDSIIGALGLDYRAYLAPRMAVLAILTSSFASLATVVATRRGNGELRRVRSTPMPPWIVLAALGIVTSVISVLSAVSTLVVGHWTFGVPFPEWLPMLAVLLVGSAAMAATGLAAATLIDDPGNALAITNGLLWPVVFISGTYMWVRGGSPLDRIAGFFPVRHLNEAAQSAMVRTPRIDGRNVVVGPHVEWLDLAVVALWGLVAAAIAVRRFRWAPASDR